MKPDPVYCGTRWYTPAYRTMLENDPHARRSVDRVLFESMVRLCAETASFLYSEFTPIESTYVTGSRPALERIVERLGPVGRSAGRRVEAVSAYCSEVGRHAPAEIEALRFGGTEEEIIARGTDWCTDIARVACALYQVGGFPARLVYLANLKEAYSGHTIVEVFWNGAWGAVDVSTDVVYRSTARRPASAWDLMTHPGLADRHYRDDSTYYSRGDQFMGAGVANYPLNESPARDFSVSSVNPYYRTILENSGRGWPGGIRWLFGENALESPFGPDPAAIGPAGPGETPRQTP
jgi:hypothetical protein